MTELKPCPFCGASEGCLTVGDVRGPVGYQYSFIACRLCGGAMIDANKGHSRNDLMKHWNLRDKRNAKFKGEEHQKVSRKDKGFGWIG